MRCPTRFLFTATFILLAPATSGELWADAEADATCTYQFNSQSGEYWWQIEESAWGQAHFGVEDLGASAEAWASTTEGGYRRDAAYWNGGFDNAYADSSAFYYVYIAGYQAESWAQATATPGLNVYPVTDPVAKAVADEGCTTYVPDIAGTPPDEIEGDVYMWVLDSRSVSDAIPKVG